MVNYWIIKSLLLQRGNQTQHLVLRRFKKFHGLCIRALRLIHFLVLFILIIPSLLRKFTLKTGLIVKPRHVIVFLFWYSVKTYLCVFYGLKTIIDSFGLVIRVLGRTLLREGTGASLRVNKAELDSFDCGVIIYFCSWNICKKIFRNFIARCINAAATLGPLGARPGVLLCSNNARFVLLSFLLHQV